MPVNPEDIVSALSILKKNEELDELVHDVASSLASDANNSGVEGQVAFLLKNGCEKDLLEMLGLKKYTVLRREVHVDHVEVIAASAAKAIEKVADGDGESVFTEYSHTLDQDTWQVACPDGRTLDASDV